MDDTKGSEIGQYVRVPYEGGAPEDVTPDLPPYSASTTPFPQPALRSAPAAMRSRSASMTPTATTCAGWRSRRMGL